MSEWELKSLGSGKFPFLVDGAEVLDEAVSPIYAGSPSESAVAPRAAVHPPGLMVAPRRQGAGQLRRSYPKSRGSCFRQLEAMDPQSEGQLVSASSLASKGVPEGAAQSGEEVQEEKLEDKAGAAPVGGSRRKAMRFQSLDSSADRSHRQEEARDSGRSLEPPDQGTVKGRSRSQSRSPARSVAEEPVASYDRLVSTLQQENGELRALQMELSREKSNLSRSMQVMELQLQSTSEENVKLKSQLEALQKTRAEPSQTETGYLEESVAGRVLIAEQEAQCAKAQLALLRERYDRIERDNRMMADEIHRFREQIGRLQQSPMQRSTSRSRYVTVGLSFLLGLAYFWFYLDGTL
ncbi:uncharacterized protein LOC134338966 [Mobula hypostoma]|uniref:uncharacterized protein LOC134338966 n=1 Tax=Mobula hypostoma TaxID=723540 RepID=UPI002FC3B896